jgi:hypothetical protein
VRPNF